MKDSRRELLDALMVLQRLGQGHLLEELHEALNKVAEEVVETGNPGAVTITLKILTQSQGNPMIIIAESVKRTPPASTPKGAAFFALDGELHKEDPRQIKMDLHTVSVNRETGEILVADAEIAERTV